MALVERGYRGLLDEYLNDMDTRAIFDELTTYASDDEWAKVEAVLPSLDDRFLAATRPVETCIWGVRNTAEHGYRAERDWWYFRVPIILDRVLDPEWWP